MLAQVDTDTDCEGDEPDEEAESNTQTEQLKFTNKQAHCADGSAIQLNAPENRCSPVVAATRTDRNFSITVMLTNSEKAACSQQTFSGPPRSVPTVVRQQHLQAAWQKS